MSEDDGTYLRRIREEGDAAAFRVLFGKYQPVVFRNALQSLGDRDAAHDVVQETFLRVWQHRSSLRPDLSFLAYVLRICGNLLRDQAKYREVRRRLEADIPLPSPSPGDDPDGSLRLKQLEARVSVIVAEKLPQKCREVFLLSRMEGMSNAEVSAALGMGEKGVEKQITRALRILRKHLRDYAE